MTTDYQPEHVLFPKLVRGQLISVDPTSTRVQQAIVFQYNPDTLTRRVEARAPRGEAGDKAEVFRLLGPPKETITLSGVEFDASDALGEGDITTRQLGIYPVLAALELLLYPSLDSIRSNLRLAQAGDIEIIPPEAPMTLFVWGRSRVLPVRLADFSITEEFYDTALNPIRARADLTLQVLSTADFKPSHPGYGLFDAHHAAKQALAGQYRGQGAGPLGATLKQYLKATST